MRILMTKCLDAPEYLDDGILHGMRARFGADVVDYPRMWWMYANSFGEGKNDLTSITARGFTYYGQLHDDDIDRSDIELKIRYGWFDLIIAHSWYPSPLLHLILEYTPKHKLAWMDGRDETAIMSWAMNYGKYFKRELIQETPHIRPVSFAFPDHKIQIPIDKTGVLSPLIPGDVKTYIYDTEQSYYDQYNRSLFGITMKKNGWDCLRHYEIMGARCVPWFIDLQDCPQTICTTLPRDLLMKVKPFLSEKTIESYDDISTRDEYFDLEYKIHQHFVKYCTTSALATYILDSMLMDS